MFEVYLDGQLVYVDAKAQYVFTGDVIDLKNRSNLTQARLNQLQAMKWESLPLNNALKTVKGNGARKLVVFSDVDCPYCRKFEAELAKVDNITVYTFLYPIEGLHPKAVQTSKQIWCAPDRNKAWDDYITGGSVPKQRWQVRQSGRRHHRARQQAENIRHPHAHLRQWPARARHGAGGATGTPAGRQREVRMSQDFWDERYATDDYIFGTAPNVFLASQAGLIRPGMRALAIADGEGRNGVWLAEQGVQVHAIDVSPVALEKARKLAAERGVTLDFEQADVLDWDWPEAAYDLVVAIFIQFAPPPERERIIAGIRNSLRPGGLLILQGYTPKQVEFATGGPPSAANMYTAELLRDVVRRLGHPASARTRILHQRRQPSPRHVGADRSGRAQARLTGRWLAGTGLHLPHSLCP